MTDLFIIGAGTAGLSAAIYAVRAGKSVIVAESSTYGGQIVNTPDIENYPGFAHISGYEFATNLYTQATSLGVKVIFEKVTGILDGHPFHIRTDHNDYEARALIIATGARNRHLGLENEERLTGRGISFCATCDGMFFKGKNVAVNGGGNTALSDALYLAGICSHVTLIHRRDSFRGDKADLDKLNKCDNVTFMLDSNVTSLHGKDHLESIDVTNVKTGQTVQVPVSALFVAIGQEPDNQIFSDIVELDEKGYIKAGADCKTSHPGIYAAGDCRTTSLRQLTTAAADGAIAATAACTYLDRN